MGCKGTHLGEDGAVQVLIYLVKWAGGCAGVGAGGGGRGGVGLVLFTMLEAQILIVPAEKPGYDDGRLAGG